MASKPLPRAVIRLVSGRRGGLRFVCGKGRETAAEMTRRLVAELRRAKRRG